MAGTNAHDDGGITGINVTPLVDVMLVLLIVFMVTANLISTKAIAVALPKATTGSDPAAATVHIAITSAGDLRLDGHPVVLKQLGQQVAALRQPGKAVNASIAADRSAAHGRVIDVIDALRGAGIVDFAFAVAAE